jgi:ribosomal protein S6
VLNITDEVLRYLLVTVDPRKAKMEARRKTKADSTEESTEEKGE